MTGAVVSLNEEKKYGFIKEDSGKDQYFFHREDFQGHWDDLVGDYFNSEKEEVKVNFEGVGTPKGLRARNVARLDWPNQTSGGV